METTSELYFKGLQCTIKNQGKQILKNINGVFPPSSLIALMGPSGSGKTTLLNILSAYNSQQTTYDSLQINGMDINFDYLRSISCYLTQDIYLNDLLTVEENMHYATDFKLGVSHSTLEKVTIISELLDSFGLTTLRKTRAGNLSGGERKRLALALEMISDPQIIYLDEPTTGLDINTTHQILTYLKKIAANGKTVICTIHQVCAGHFELFDFAYVIVDGQCAYQGCPQELVPFLDEHGMPCNIYHNPADYIIELCCGEYGQDKRKQLVEASQYGFQNIKKNPKEIIPSTIKSNNNIDVNWSYKFKTLLRRERINLQRNWFLTHLRFFGSIFMALCIGALFYNIGCDASKVYTNYNLVITITSNLILTGLMYPILSFPQKMEITKREIHNHYYSILHYYLSTTIWDFPISVVTIMSSNMLIYYLTGQNLELQRVYVFVIFTLAVGTTVNAIGFFFGTWLNLHDALVLCSCFHIILMSLSGFAILPQDVPYLFNILSEFFYPRTAVQGFLVGIFGLDPQELHCPEERGYCYFTSAHHFLETLQYDPLDYISPLYVIAAWYIIIRVITYFTMKYRLSFLR